MDESHTSIQGNNVMDISKTISFHWYDYTLFSIVLGFSTLIGLYFGCFHKQNTKKAYLLGGKQMKVWPIAISLVASHSSAITLLAIPADIYRYGIGYWQGSISLIFVHLATAYVYLPVFYKLEVTSTYEYLGLRFDEKTRMMASALYTISLLLYLPIVIYVPALGFSAATGISLHVIAPIACGICIFYTTIGGLKAVVWTDTFQFTLTIGCLVTVLFVATEYAGGVLSIWNKCSKGKRLEVDFDPDPTKRDAFWTVVFGLILILCAQNSINQGCLQKFLALPSLKDAQKSCLIYLKGVFITKTVSVLIGLTMYAYYTGCDPLLTKKIARNDQLVPFFIMNVADKIPGLIGIFFAGVFSAALSSLSANLNCVSGTLYTDFISKLFRNDISEEMISNILKLLVVVAGIGGWLMVYVIENLGDIVQLTISVRSIADAPLLAIFTMGMLSRRFHSHGAFYGSIIGMMFMAWQFSMVKYYETLGYNNYETKPLSTENCTYNFTLSETKEFIPKRNGEEIFILFRLSFYYNCALGVLVTILAGSLISAFTTEKDDRVVPKELLSPIIYWMYPDIEKQQVQDVIEKDIKYYNIEKAQEMTMTEANCFNVE